MASTSVRGTPGLDSASRTAAAPWRETSPNLLFSFSVMAQHRFATMRLRKRSSWVSLRFENYRSWAGLNGIATWNLRRPRGLDSRLERLLSKIREVDADIWILTETHHNAVPGSEYRSSSSIELGGIFVAGERRTTIWSRLPIISEQQVGDPETAACVEVETPGGRMIVYGTVLPYGNAGTNYAYRSGGQLQEGRKAWELHYESIAEHELEIEEPRRAFSRSHTLLRW